MTSPRSSEPPRGLGGARARELARGALKHHLELTNYTTNWRRLGFTDDDLADGGSDRLVDSLVALGDAKQIAARIGEHLDAGADHVCLQLIVEPGVDPLPGYRELAEVLQL
jgi:probable F420-dependent oxidoreductase